MNPGPSQGDDRCGNCNSKNKILHFKQCNQNTAIKTVAWFHCLLQDSIVCKLVSHMQIKSSPWVLVLCQLNPPLSKTGLRVSAWLHMERVVSALSYLFPTDSSRNLEHSVFEDCRRVFLLVCFLLCSVLQ